MGDVSRFDGASEEGAVNAGDEVSDSLDTERSECLSMAGSKVVFGLLIEK